MPSENADQSTPDHHPSHGNGSEPPAISDELLVRLALGELDGPEAASIRARLDRAPNDRRRADDLAATLRSLSETRRINHQFQVPGAVVQRLAQATHGPLAGSGPNALQRLRERIATVVFDSWRAPALAGVRGGALSRLMKIETDGLELDLRIDRDETREMSVVAGEVRAEPLPQRLALRQISTGLERVISVASDGYFDFEAPSGQYSLHLQFVAADPVAVDAIDL